MRKKFLGILATVITLSFSTTTLFAAEPKEGYYFVDMGGHGICDNADSMCRYAYVNGNRSWDMCKGNFVDADNDGFCDNYRFGLVRENRQCISSQGRCGRNFIDSDKNSICNSYVSSQNLGGGYGRISQTRLENHFHGRHNN